MLAFEKAFETVLKSARRLGAERVDISRALNRVLAEDFKSDMDMPPFDKSVMDGFACRREDLISELTIVETIPAGCVPKKIIGANQCAKIMTGAVVPTGADCVVMKEFIKVVSDNIIRFVGESTEDNISRKGEDTKAGDIVLHQGIILRPQHIAVLASVGKVNPLVANKPKVAIIATGNELVQPASKPNPAQIRNSNSFQLAAQVESTGAIAVNCGIAKDTIGAIDGIFNKAVKESDVVIISGGVSTSEFDLVRDVLRHNNIEPLFETIAIVPGKRTVFALSDKAYCFALPGNPASTFVLFEILVKPFLYKLMGHDYRPRNLLLPLGESLIRKKTKRQRWLPTVITDAGTVRPVEYHGSAHISSLCQAHGLVNMDIGVAEIERGTTVKVRLI